jgi:hypothetical protein
MQIVFSALMLGLVLVAGSVPAFGEGGKKSEMKYDPAIMYPGPYTPEHLFYRNPKGTIWLPWIAGDFTKKVNCSGALKRLKRRGVWKGHLNTDGSCGPPAEPSDWAVGNWLNFVQSSRPINRD